jgi:phage host-nuclease inhibitor protein Gam
MKTQRKGDRSVALKTRSEADAAVSRLVDRQIVADGLQNTMEARLAEIRGMYAEELGALGQEISELLDQVEVWALANPGEFPPKKSLELTHATIGFRTGMPRLKLLGRGSWKKSFEKVRTDPDLSMYIRTSEELNREALIADRETLDPKTLANVGLKVVQDETFFVDPKKEGVL